MTPVLILEEHSASQVIPHILLNPHIQYHAHKKWPLVPVQGQINLYTPIYISFLQVYLPNSVWISPLPCMPYAPLKNLPQFDHPTTQLVKNTNHEVPHYAIFSSKALGQNILLSMLFLNSLS